MNLLWLINSMVLLTEIGEELHKTEKAHMDKYTWRKIDEIEEESIGKNWDQRHWE